jgi:nicotinamide mononucleotide (NMN) deamidase PncC
LESNTGGHVAQRLQKAIAGFDPVILQRQQEAPTALDEASTIALAQSLRRESGATYALAILGSSGEDQGIWGQGQGETWLAAVSEQDVKKSRLGYSGNDEYSVIRTSNQGLLMLERVTRAR